MSQSIIEAAALTKHFAVRTGLRGKAAVHAVDEVTVALAPGEVVAVVGESGSGKTTLGRMMARLEQPTAGTIRLHGAPVPRGGARALRPFRREVQVVFQDPYASLNSAHTVGYHLERPLRLHGLATTREEVAHKVAALLERVHLSPAADFVHRYPAQLSGGQRQRVAIARALAVDPTVVIADEPVASLDVSIRLGVLNVFAETARSGCAVLYITHDIASARYFADRIVVMYAGRIVEHGPAEQVTTDPQHPYTRMLIASAPDPARPSGTEAPPPGEVPSLVRPPSGCRFHPRCPQAMAVCSRQTPPAYPGTTAAHAACWLHHPHPDARSGTEEA